MTVRTAWRLLRTDPKAYALAWLQWVAFHCFPLAIGWAFKAVLDRVTGGATAGSPWALLAVLGGLELARWALLVSAAVQWHGCWVGWQTVPRVNLLTSLVRAPGPVSGRLPGSPGEAVSRFRDDTKDLAMVLDVWLDISGSVLATTGALAIMLAIDARVTLAMVVPMVLALWIARALGARLRTWRRTAREATAGVTGFVGDAFGAVLAIKAAGAERAVAKRFADINATRAVAARRDQVGTQLVQSLSGATGEASIGVLLLLVAPAIRRGDFTVGDLGLFTSYVVVLAALPRWTGRLGAYHRQAEVSIGRLAELLPETERHPDLVVAAVPTHLRHGPPTLNGHAVAPTTPLRELAIDDLTVRHPQSGRGIDAVSLEVSQGELVVVTGPVGGGKSTLLRALLGLIPTDGGTVRWNGVPIPADERPHFLAPPRSAYIPQVPRLFSEALADTILLGMADDDLDLAVWLACLDEDIAAMADGLATMVGPKGVRLSGGQAQRSGAARALVRRPELLVVDDVSSALDAETEARMWDRIFGAGAITALVVTHRPQLIDRADRVLVLGR